MIEPLFPRMSEKVRYWHNFSGPSIVESSSTIFSIFQGPLNALLWSGSSQMGWLFYSESFLKESSHHICLHHRSPAGLTFLECDRDSTIFSIDFGCRSFNAVHLDFPSSTVQIWSCLSGWPEAGSPNPKLFHAFLFSHRRPFQQK
jgi:hypothetical protein